MFETFIIKLALKRLKHVIGKRAVAVLPAVLLMKIRGLIPGLDTNESLPIEVNGKTTYAFSQSLQKLVMWFRSIYQFSLGYKTERSRI